MSHIKFEVNNRPTAEDDKLISDGIVQFNSNILQEKPSHFSIFVKQDIHASDFVVIMLLVFTFNI